MTSQEAFAYAMTQTVAQLGLHGRLSLRGWLQVFRATRRAPRCEECGRLWGLELQHKMTCYEDEPAVHVFCHRCAETYRQYWDSMWSDYYGSVM